MDAPLTRIGLLMFGLTLVACGGGGGGGDTPFQGTPVESTPSAAELEPNESFLEATALSAAGAGHGTIFSGVGSADVDVWSFSATAGSAYSLELFGLRHDYYGWRDACDRPSITLLDLDGVTPLLSHDPSTLAENRGDRGFPLWMAPVNGDYFIRITSQAGGQGNYALLVQAVDGSFSQEAGEPNDDPSTAEPIAPGLLRGTAEGTSNDLDHYSFDVFEPSIVRVEMVSYRNGLWKDETSPPLAVPFLVDDLLFKLVGPSPAYSGDMGFDVVVSDPGTYYLQILTFLDFVASTDTAYWLRLDIIPLGSGLEVEPNATLTDADPIAYGGIISGELDSVMADAADLLTFEGTAGDLVRLHVFGPGTHLGSSGMLGVQILDSAGAAIPASGDTGGALGTPTIRLMRALLPASGTYYIHLSDQSETGPVQWAVELELVQASRWESEPNGTTTSADPLDSDGRAAGRVEMGDVDPEVDAFAFHVDAPGLVMLDLYAAASFPPAMPFHDGHGSTLIPSMNVQVRDGGELITLAESVSIGDFCGFAYDTADPLPTITLSFVATFSGTHYAVIGTQEGTVDGDAIFLLEID